MLDLRRAEGCGGQNRKVIDRNRWACEVASGVEQVWIEQYRRGLLGQRGEVHRRFKQVFDGIAVALEVVGVDA